MAIFDVDDVPIGWRECGSGPVVVFLHGLGGSRTAWDPQLVGLAEDFRCVAWDMPGYGVSHPLDHLSFAAIADAVRDLVERLGVERVHLVGESFGGMHALHTAIRHPNVVDRMVLTNTSAVFGDDGTDAEQWKRSRLDRIDRGATPGDIALDVYSAIGGPNLVGSRLAKRVASFSRIGVEGFRAAVECLPDHDVLTSLANIASPTLVIAGELDEETPPSYGTALAAGIPSAELEILAGVGHIAASEVPVRFNELVGEFLTQGDQT